MINRYDKNFFDIMDDGATTSAKEVAPIIINQFNPKSAIDVGCGLGSWAAEFRSLGLEVVGMDGPFVDKKYLRIPPEQFITFDLKSKISLDSKFDLVICLEVGEHLPESSSKEFVKGLTSLGKVILFSAAIPFQGGTTHINEQWPSYWAKLFKKEGFVPIDFLRPKLWNDKKIKWWYRQNMVIYIEKNNLNKYPNLEPFMVEEPLPLVHPDRYLMHPLPLHKHYIKKIIKITNLGV